MNELELMALADKLTGADLPIASLDKEGVIIWAVDPSEEQKQAAEAVIAGFVPPEPPKEYEIKRAGDYIRELPQGDMYDAFIKIGLNIQEYAKNGIRPDASAKPGTPEWLLGTAVAIKERHPKEEGDIKNG